MCDLLFVTKHKFDYNLRLCMLVFKKVLYNNNNIINNNNNKNSNNNNNINNNNYDKGLKYISVSPQSSLFIALLKRFCYITKPLWEHYKGRNTVGGLTGKKIITKFRKITFVL